MSSLYHKEKYSVYTGGGSSVGFCTAWNEPERLFGSSEILRTRAAIVGTLYSRHGVNVLLRNLALNPQIRTLFLWGNGRLSNTNYGVIGTSILKQLWTQGFDDSGKVHGTQFTIEKEIDRTVLKKMREAVTLRDISELTFAEAEQKVEEAERSNIGAYMEPVSFPEPVIETPATFPSEEVGWLVRGKTVLETWAKVVERIMRYGTIKGTQYGSQQRELIGVSWVIHGDNSVSPDLSLASDWPEDLRQITGALETNLKNYYPVITTPDVPGGVAYTYGNRLMAYPLEGGSSLDQIQHAIIGNLKDSADSRRAAATTIIPSTDAFSKDPPCLTYLQALQANGKINLLVTFRSHDIFKGSLANVFALLSLLERIAKEIGCERGALKITSESAHIYEQDWNNAEKFVRCKVWDRQPYMFYDAADSDPRGYALVSLTEGKLGVKFHAPNNTELISISGSAQELILKLSQLELFSQTIHAMDIAAEITKADFARELDLPYTQDRPLIF